MKRLIKIVVTVSVMAVMMSVGVYALPEGSWVSGVTVANLTDESASVTITFYNQDGTTALEYDGGTIDPNGSKQWYLPSGMPDLGDGFMGSAVVQSDKEVAASVNTQLPSGSDPARVGTSTGIGSGAPTMYATQLHKAYYGWNSYCGVQNTSSESFDVTASYYDSDGELVDTDTETIPAYASHVFDQGEDDELPNSFNGSAKFEGDDDHPLAVVCNFYNTGTTADASQFHSYNGMGSGGSALYIPRLVKDYYGYQSGLRVQNIGTVPLSVTVKYNFAGNVYTQTSPSFGSGQSWGPYLGDESQLPVSMEGLSGSGSAVVTVNNSSSDKVIIATVNEDNRVDPAGRGVTYLGALESDATSTVVFPQVTAEYYGYSSGIQVAKVGDGEATCEANYAAMGSVDAFSDSFTLTDANPSWSQFAPNGSGMSTDYDDYSGAVTVNCTGAPVIGITNLSFRGDIDPRYDTLTGDSFTTSRGVNK
jgi:hypothetical protein